MAWMMHDVGDSITKRLKVTVPVMHTTKQKWPNHLDVEGDWAEKALSLDSTHRTIGVWEGCDEGLALVEYTRRLRTH